MLFGEQILQTLISALAAIQDTILWELAPALLQTSHSLRFGVLRHAELLVALGKIHCAANWQINSGVDLANYVITGGKLRQSLRLESGFVIVANFKVPDNFVSEEWIIIERYVSEKAFHESRLQSACFGSSFRFRIPFAGKNTTLYSVIQTTEPIMLNLVTQQQLRNVASKPHRAYYQHVKVDLIPFTAAKSKSLISNYMSWNPRTASYRLSRSVADCVKSRFSAWSITHSRFRRVRKFACFDESSFYRNLILDLGVILDRYSGVNTTLIANIDFAAVLLGIFFESRYHITCKKQLEAIYHLISDLPATIIEIVTATLRILD